MFDPLLMFCAAAVGGGLAGWGFSRLFASVMLRQLRDFQHELGDLDRQLLRETKRRASQARFEQEEGLDELIGKELQQATAPPQSPGWWPGGGKFKGRTKE